MKNQKEAGASRLTSFFAVLPALIPPFSIP